ncbi:Do family serine endopeptidase [Agarilytica rhodophyticola]|uniref:Do family serine endopeptidase n=1 Tax=Agarilytica rhodophyticola TaxID=1737490 RepID=UPI000B347DAE|nr:Do family serine endopeptidase [Agarilytica rhodophyticola]
MIRVSVFATIFLFLLTINSAQAARGLPDFTDLIEKTSPAVVKINTTTKSQRGNLQLPQGQEIPDIFRRFFEPRGELPERNLHSMGSGFFISADGYLLTNNHVIENADEVVVRLTDRREYDAVVVGVDPLSDLALLKVEEKGLPFLKLADGDSLKVGEWVVAIGSPFGLDFSASAGIVSAKGRSIPNGSNGNYVPFIQTDVAINPGNSGGPLFNMDGQVVGVNSQIYTRSGGSIGLSFAIPSSMAINVVKQLKKKGRVDRGWLGVVIQEVDKDLANSFGLKNPRGALIASMEEDGPAASSGLRAGDIIIRFGDDEIIESADLPHAVGITAPGEKVSVIVMREGKRREIMVKVGTRGGEVDLASTSSGDSKPKSGANGRLGISVAKVESAELKRLGIKGGVSVVEVDADGPVGKAGVKVGDVIAQLGFEEITSVKNFEKIVKDLPSGSLLPIRFFSNGLPVFRTITLE